MIQQVIEDFMPW